jgi:hypothetical protein
VSKGNIVSQEWGVDGNFYVQFQLRGGDTRWYVFSGLDAAAVAGGDDPRDHSGQECSGPPAAPIGEGFGGAASSAGGAAESAEFGEIAAGLL